MNLLCSCFLFFYAFLCLPILHLNLAMASDDEGLPTIGEGKAIEKVDEQQGFQLSKNAIQELGLKTQIIQSQTTHVIPKSAFVYFQDFKGIYRLRGGWFKRIDLQGEIHPASPSKGEFIIKTNDLIPGDQWVIEGVPLLRIAELSTDGNPSKEHHSAEKSRD